MVWFKVDDSFYDHPKTEELSDSAVALWTRAGSYCAKHLTDGFVSHRKADRMCESPATAITELVHAGLWEKDGDGYRFHDWHEYQPTREEALAASKAKSVGGAVGNHRRWHVERGKRDPQCPYCTGSDRITDRITDQSTESLPNRPTRPDPTRPDHLPSEGLFSPPQAAADTKPSKPAKRPTERGTRIPDDFGISQEMRRWATEEIPKFDIDREFPKFRDYWRSQPGQRGVRKEWPAVFRNWMRRASEQNPPAAYPDNRSHNGANGIALRDQQPRQSTGTQRMQQALDVAAQLDEQFANGGNS